MVDQQQKFVAKGIRAEFVGEAQMDHTVMDKVLRGDLQLLYISPENLLNNKTYRSMLLSPTYTDKLVALAVDEAHCIKTWSVNVHTVLVSVLLSFCLGVKTFVWPLITLVI